ncbi:MAG: DUF4403 family protein [Myxococcales bacterium]|nr:DUF4403 family protein [Myxococcales bacterium]
MFRCAPVRLAVASAVLAGLATSCARSPARDLDSGALSESEQCSQRVDATPFTAAPPPALPAQRSRIGVDVRAELSALERELGRAVPVTLASEQRRPVGAPGEVSYVVRRGRFGLSLGPDRLLVNVPVEVEVEICKPLGPFCPTYGRCSPRLAAVASVPLYFDENYAVGRSRVGISLQRSCVIAGIDAAPQIKSQAAREIGNVQRRIDASMPDLRGSVAGVWELLHHPIALGRSTCLLITPDRITQSRPKLSKRTLESQLGAEGTLRIQDPCEANGSVKPAPLPPLTTREDTTRGIELRVPIRASWGDVSAGLTRSIANRGARGSQIWATKIDASAVSVDGKPAVLLRTTVAGRACGDLWFLAEPWFDSKTGRVRLRNLRAAPGTAQGTTVSALARSIEEHASVALPVDISAGPASLGALVQGFGTGLPEGVAIESEMAKATVERVHPEAEGLVALAVFAGSTTLRVQ